MPTTLPMRPTWASPPAKANSTKPPSRYFDGNIAGGRLLAKLDTIAPSALSNEQNLDRLAFRARLLRECEDFEQGRHMLDPHGLDEVFDFLLREMQRGETEPKRAAKNIRSLLSGTPRYLTQAARLIERPERVWRDIMDGAFKASGSFFDAVASF